MKPDLFLLFIVPVLLSFSGCAGGGSGQEGEDPSISPPAILSYRVLNEFRHDSLAFTQGLAYYEGRLYESTGAPEAPANNGTWIAEVDLEVGKYDKKVDLGRKYFGEGIAFLGDRLYQLTYTTRKGFIFDARTFNKIGEFSYGSEGWGLTSDGTYLIMSTGTSNLYYMHPDSLHFVRTLAVRDHRGFVRNLNELEYINGSIFANEWLTSNILRIDPATGVVTGKLDLSRLTNQVKARYPGAQEMNGIAYDSLTGRTIITGKNWPVFYEISW